MRLVFLLMLLPILGCQEATQAPSTATGSTVSAPKNGKTTTTPKKPAPKKPGPETADIYKVPNEFARYIDKFYTLMGKAGLNNYRRNIQFLMEPKLGPNIAGNCTYSSDTNLAVIRINPNFWWNYSFERRESLMFHELGHCVLYRGHIDTLNNFNRADSVMHPFGLPYDDEYLDYYSNYLTELFRASPDKFAMTRFVPSYYWEHAYHASSAETNAYREDFVSVQNSFADLPPDIECGSH